MADLEVEIRTRLAAGVDAPTLARVVAAVLDAHWSERTDDRPPYCVYCSGLSGIRVFEPCATKRAMARELGIRVQA